MVRFKLCIICLFALQMGYGQSDTMNIVNNKVMYTFYLDAYYRNDLAGAKLNNKTSFTNSNNAIQIGMVSFRVDKNWAKFSGTLDLGVGKRENEFSYNDKGLLQDVKQLTLSYAPGAKLKFTAGKWATHIGYELLDAYSNRNYSMSYAFSYGPFFHTGVRADIVLGKQWNLMLGIVQPSDFVISNTPYKMAIAQINAASINNDWKAFLNCQLGKDKTQLDFVGTHIFSDKWAINYDATLANVAGLVWTSNALYLNYDLNSKVGFTWRSELFDDTKSAVGIGTTIFQNTVSANFHVSKFTIIPEFRMDNAKNTIFINRTGASHNMGASFLVAAIYKW